jgi:alpha-tubulin suppressor-like RCC1 family protein
MICKNPTRIGGGKMFRSRLFATFLLLSSLVACGGGGSSGGGAASGSGSGGGAQNLGWVTIDEPVSQDTMTTDRELIEIAGSAFVNNTLPDKCRGLNCDASYPTSNCTVCTSGTSVSWTNSATGDRGTAGQALKFGECPVSFLFGCEVVTGWASQVCLVAGKNEIAVEAKGSRGSASDLITVTLDHVPLSIAPGVPAGLSVTPAPNQVTVSWSPNPAAENVITYDVYMAETNWTQWSNSLPGARHVGDVRCCSHVQTNLTNLVTYWFAVSATNCSGEGALTEEISVTPELKPTSIEIDPGTDVLAVGNSRDYIATVRDALDRAIPGLVVDWSSSDSTVAEVESSGLFTDSSGRTSATVTVKAAGAVVISAEITGAGVAGSISITGEEPLSGVMDIAAGEEHTCALMDVGRLKCWGDNEWGQLGDGSTHDQPRPADVAGIMDVAIVTGGSWHTCALKLNGQVMCWGFDNHGQLGAGDAVTLFSKEPVVVAGLTSRVVSIASARHHNCAVTAAGAVKCWGINGNGQLGDGSTDSSDTPVDVVGLNSGQVTVAAGDIHSCALSAAGVVHCWGGNSHGQLGDGTNTQSLTPVRVAQLNDDYISVVAGSSHTCAMTAARGARCWGGNFSGQLGNGGTTSDNALPGEVSQLADLLTLVAGGLHSCAINNIAKAYCWGSNRMGQLGDGSTSSRNLPIKLKTMGREVLAVAAGAEHTCALTDDGQVMCSGGNSSGQIGDGTQFNRRLTMVGVVAE